MRKLFAHKLFRASTGLVVVVVTLVGLVWAPGAQVSVVHAEPPVRPPATTIGPLTCADKRVSNALIPAFAWLLCDGGNPSENIFFNYMDNAYRLDADVSVPFDAAQVRYDITPRAGDIPDIFEIYGNTDGSSTYTLCATHTNTAGTNTVALSCGPISYLLFHQIGSPKWQHLDNVYLDSPTPTPTPTPYVPPANILCDGDMEQFPTSSCWINGRPGTTGFGRLRDTDFLTRIYHGEASCHDGFQAIGKQQWPFSVLRGYGPIEQNFEWPGGDMYIAYDARRDSRLTNGATPVHLTANIYQVDEFSFHPVASHLIDNGWSGFQYVVADLDAGTYKIEFATSDEIEHTAYVDNVRVSANGYAASYCSGPTSTGTPAPTSTVTRTPTPTSTPQTLALTNCDFEQGTSGWTFNSTSYVNTQGGGPVRPKYALAQGARPNISQVIAGTWGGGYVYVEIWVRGRVQIRMEKVNGGGTYGVFDNSTTYLGWQNVQTYVYLPPGQYRLVLNKPLASVEAAYDGITLSRNTWSHTCSVSGTPTATSSPTRTPTPTHSTGTPDPSATSPGEGTPTLSPSPSTPATGTPPPTYTPRPSSSPAPSSTQSDAEKTATAEGTDVPTYTPGPSATPGPSVTPGGGGGGGGGGTSCDEDHPLDCPVPPQPEPGGGGCVRPQQFWEVAGWIDYETCRILTFTLWNGENTGQILEVEGAMQTYEPLGTIAELREAADMLQSEIQAWDWANTGMQDGRLPDLRIFFPNSTPTGILTGNFDLNPNSNDGFAFVTTCSIQTITVFGDAMGKGFCASINWMQATGIMAWAQWLFDIAVWWAFISYAWRTVTVEIPKII